MKGKKVLIVGGSGTWGRALIGQLLDKGVARVRILGRNEHNIVELLRSVNDERVEFVIGDIRDKSSMMKACEDMNFVFHLAALKHVPICEQIPTQAILTNVVGTQNLIEAAISQNVDKLIYSSTDKVVEPFCTYGCTKLLGEKLVLSGNEESKSTRFIVFRSGNLLGSSGSVVPLFERQIAESKEVTLTDRKMNRFFIPIFRAASLIIDSAIYGNGGEIFVPRMESILIEDLARFMLKKKGLEEDNIRVVGMRPGERLNESLITKDESKYIYRVKEDLFVVGRKGDGLCVHDDVLRVSDCWYNSEDSVLPYEKAEEFLRFGLV